MSINYKISYTDIKQFGSSDKMPTLDISEPIILHNEDLDENIYENIFQEDIIYEKSLKWGAIHLNKNNINQLVEILYKFSLLEDNTCDFLLPFLIDNEIKKK